MEQTWNDVKNYVNALHFANEEDKRSISIKHCEAVSAWIDHAKYEFDIPGAIYNDGFGCIIMEWFYDNQNRIFMHFYTTEHANFINIIYTEEGTIFFERRMLDNTILEPKR